MKYYLNTLTASVYRTEETKFSDGTPTLRLQRWNWCMENWNGHINDHEETRRLLAEGEVIIEISEEESIERRN